MSQDSNQIGKLPQFGKFMLLFWVYGKIMVSVTQKSRRAPHERISITASVAARLWFQFWQDYPSNDTYDVKFSVISPNLTNPINQALILRLLNQCRSLKRRKFVIN